MRYPSFRHEIVTRQTPGSENDICLLTDLTGNGWLDIIIGGKYGADNLCWYEAPDWDLHIIGEAYLEAGGALVDINGDGRLDLVAGEAWGPQSRRPGGGHALYWFEQPPNPRDRWRQHVIEDGLHKYHDQAVGDVDGDGELEILITSQIAGIVAYYDIPDDLRVSRWPYSVRHIVADDLSVEGLAIGDVNGDGANEIIAGTHIFYPPSEPGCRWERHDLDDLDRPVVALGDLNNDGVPDLVAAEGELNEGRLVWYDVYNGRKHVLADDLFHPHSLGLADFTGNGSLDIFVGEMGLGTHEKTRLIIWVNNGHGQFVPVTISEGYPTHGAQVGDVNGDGKPDIVGKPYRPGRTVDIWWNTW